MLFLSSEIEGYYLRYNFHWARSWKRWSNRGRCNFRWWRRPHMIRRIHWWRFGRKINFSLHHACGQISIRSHRGNLSCNSLFLFFFLLQFLLFLLFFLLLFLWYLFLKLKPLLMLLLLLKLNKNGLLISSTKYTSPSL